MGTAAGGLSPILGGQVIEQLLGRSLIEAEGLSPVVPVVALDAGESDLVLAPPGTALSPKMTAFTWA